MTIGFGGHAASPCQKPLKVAIGQHSRLSQRSCCDQKPHITPYFAFLYGIFIKNQHDSRSSLNHQQHQLSIKVFPVYRSPDFLHPIYV